jgi:HEAT repeat protein
MRYCLSGLCMAAFFCGLAWGQTNGWLENELKLQRERMASTNVEERRDAILRLGSLLRPEASRVALTGLTDAEPIVRATAARAVLSLPPDEAVNALTPLLGDKFELPREEAAYALGETRTTAAVKPLLTALAQDKSTGVRGAAIVALGLLKDETAVELLTQVLTRRVPSEGFYGKVLRRKDLENPFIRRAAAQALGRIGSRAAVPALIAALSDPKAGEDVRREAARSLAAIGDPAAVPALRAARTAGDPYLARIAFDALQKIAPDQANRPN